MKVTRTLAILTLVLALVLGGTMTAFASGPPKNPGQDKGTPKHGLFGTVTSVDTVSPGAVYVLYLQTKRGTVALNLDESTTYLVPGEARGPQNLGSFVDLMDANGDGNLDELKDHRVAALVTDGDKSAQPATCLRLMLLPSIILPSLPHALIGQVKDIQYDPGQKEGSFTLSTLKHGDVPVRVDNGLGEYGPGTKFRIPGISEPNLGDLKAGDRVAVTGIWWVDGFLAQGVRVIPARPLPVLPFSHCTGTVTEPERLSLPVAEDVPVTVQRKPNGETVTFWVTPETKWLPKGVSTLEKGELITAVLKKDEEGKSVAKIVMVHRLKKAKGKD